MMRVGFLLVIALAALAAYRGGPSETMSASVAQESGIRMLVAGWLLLWCAGLLRRVQAITSWWQRLLVVVAPLLVAANGLWLASGLPDGWSEGSPRSWRMARVALDSALFAEVLIVPVVAILASRARAWPRELDE